MKELNINMGIIITYLFGVRSVQPIVFEKFANIVSTKHTPLRLFVILHKIKQRCSHACNKLKAIHNIVIPNNVPICCDFVCCIAVCLLFGLFYRNFDQGFSRVYVILVHSCPSCRNAI
jgi:hypothetical protein